MSQVSTPDYKPARVIDDPAGRPRAFPLNRRKRDATWQGAPIVLFGVRPFEHSYWRRLTRACSIHLEHLPTVAANPPPRLTVYLPIDEQLNRSTQFGASDVPEPAAKCLAAAPS